MFIEGKQHGASDYFVTLGEPLHNNITRDSAYVVVPATMTFKVRGQQVTLRLRILDGGPAGILTVKGRARFHRRVKIREETEVEVADARIARELLELLGHRVAVTYHKHRETWRIAGIDVTLDTLDFGSFCEVEGPLEEIEALARRLGLDPKRALKSSYSDLAKAHAS